MGSLLNFRFIIGTVGIVLIVCHNPFLFFPTAIFSLVFRIPVYQDVMTWYSLFVLGMTAGLVLYIIGRKELLDLVKDIKISIFKDILEFRISYILTLFGLIITMDSLGLLGVAFAGTTYSGWGPLPMRTTREWIVFSLLLAWSGLTFLSGVLWLVDGAKIREDEVLPLKKETDFEEAWKKYPKDLFTKYVTQYPHNPSGVLEWHIDKKMKKGITREQAIEELTRESEPSKLS